MAGASGDSVCRFAIPNTLAGLRDGLGRLNQWLSQALLCRETEDRANLIFEEIVTNVIRHAFDDRGEHPIEITLRSDPEMLRLEFVDAGRPFDPRSAPKTARAETLDEATVGGRGLILVNKAASALDYERTADGRNRLTVALQRVGRSP